MRVEMSHYEDKWTDEQVKFAVTFGAELYTLRRGPGLLKNLVSQREVVSSLHETVRLTSHWKLDEKTMKDLAVAALKNYESYPKEFAEYTECSMIAHRLAVDVLHGEMTRNDAVNLMLMRYQALYPGGINPLFQDPIPVAAQRADEMLESMYGK